jgi:hypothetical protein
VKLATELLDKLADELLGELAGFELEAEELHRLELLLTELVVCIELKELLTFRLLLLRLDTTLELLVTALLLISRELLLEATKELLVAGLLLATRDDALDKELAGLLVMLDELLDRLARLLRAELLLLTLTVLL